jgi:hypothetical protein
MRSLVEAVVVAALSASVLPGCSSTTAARAVQESQMPRYAQARSELPALRDDAVRLYIYRPQAIVGMWGAPVVLVNGTRMGNPSNPVAENLLLPGAVFVVDTPARATRATWIQSSRGEETDKAIDLDPQSARTVYLRWDLKPTYGYLQPIEPKQALAEIESLVFTGYVNLLPR